MTPKRSGPQADVVRAARGPEMAGTHVTVCICTYKRPDLLGRLLIELERQNTAAGFSYSIVVADNDGRRSACDIVALFSGRSPLTVTYCVESEQNIALARNRAIAHANGDYIAFIDDDEFPDEDWLARMLDACEKFGADGVLGPVRPFFVEPPPTWLLESGLCERPEYETGTWLPWRQTRAGNALFHRRILVGPDPPFRREFGHGGEDQDFFKRMIESGRRFVWCNEAAVYEIVPPPRMRRRYFLARALRRGQGDRPFLNATAIVKSLLALPVYTALILITGVLGQHVLMKCCVRLLDHMGRLLGAVGIEPAPGKYLGEATGRPRLGWSAKPSRCQAARSPAAKHEEGTS